MAPLLRSALGAAWSVVVTAQDAVVATAEAVVSLDPSLFAGDGTFDWPGFGSGALALSGDGRALLVSVESFNESRGAAYSFACNGDTLRCGQPRVLLAEDAEPQDAFSRSLAISGDGLLAAFGAPGRGGGAGGVFTSACLRSGVCGNASAVAFYDVAVGDAFGSAVAIDHAGTMLAVGAPGRSGGVGAVFIFSCSYGRCSAAPVSELAPGRPLPVPEGAPLRFGAALALSASGMRLIITAPQQCCGEGGRESTGFGEPGE